MGFWSFIGSALGNWARRPLWIRIPGGLAVAALGVWSIWSARYTGGRSGSGAVILGILLAFLGMAMMLNGPTESELHGYQDE